MTKKQHLLTIVKARHKVPNERKDRLGATQNEGKNSGPIVAHHSRVRPRRLGRRMRLALHKWLKTPLPRAQWRDHHSRRSGTRRERNTTNTNRLAESLPCAWDRRGR